MASVMTETLARLLLRLSEAGEPAILWGRQARPHRGREFDRLVSRRLLVEQTPATEWHVCAGCECGLAARPIEEIGGRLAAVCPLDHRADVVLDPDDRQSFRIDAGNLVRAVASASGLSSQPAMLVDSVWDLGRLSGDRAVVIVLSTAAAADPNLVAIVRAATRTSAVTMLLPASHDMTARRRITDAGVDTVVARDVIGGGGRPFALDVDRLVPRSSVALRLILRAERQVAVLDGRETKLSDRSFKLLHLLAEALIGTGGIVSQRVIERHLWATTVSERAAADAVRDLREQLGRIMPRGEDPDTVIETHHGKGYALALTAQEVEIRV